MENRAPKISQNTHSLSRLLRFPNSEGREPFKLFVAKHLKSHIQGKNKVSSTKSVIRSSSSWNNEYFSQKKKNELHLHHIYFPNTS
jgi:hypothetical protein